MAMKTSPTSERSKLKKKLSDIYKELSRPVRKGSKSLGTTLSSDFTPSGKNRRNLQKEFDKVSAQLKKVSGGAAATRKAAPALKTSPAKKKMSFKEAFAAARKAGKKEFTWNGGRYNTMTKEEAAKAKKKATLKKTVAKTGADSRKISNQRKRKAAGKYVGPRQEMVDRTLKAKRKPKGVGVAMRGYGGAMKK